jgi:sigma-B regulation protein RsbU (phosphoserine phosphatase)
MKRNRNISSTLSIYLLVSQMLLAVVIIIAGVWFTKNLAIENLFHKLRYHTEEAISPIRTSMNETEWLINNLTAEFDLEKPSRYAPFIFKAKPGVVALRFVIFNPKDTNQIQSDYFLYREGDTIKSDQNSFSPHFPLAEKWMKDNSHSHSPQWSSPFYSNDKASKYNQVFIFSSPIISKSSQKNISGVLFCAISIDREIADLHDLEVLKKGFPVLISGKGEIIYPPEQLIKEKHGNLENYLADLNVKQLIKDNKEGFAFINQPSSELKKAVILYWPVNKTNWLMVAVLPKSEYLSAVNKMLYMEIPIILIILGISAFIVIYLSRKLVSPITVLADASRKMMEEEGIKNSTFVSEVDVLSQSIELMKRKLRNYEKERLKTEMDNEEMDKELKLAREIEMGIVPTKFPLFPGRTDFDCYGKLLPAKIVGGDLFDFFLLDENHLFISICDTLGKGIPAAMFAVATRTLIRSIANPITRLGKMMELLNDELSLGHESDMYVTVMMGRLDLISGEFAYCNAGHPRPFILRNNNQIEEFNTTHGFPIGVRKNQKYVETIVKLNPGETIIAYTDGITEEVDKTGAFFGKERLYTVIQSNNSATPEKFVKEVLKNLEKFRGKKEIYDDTTILALKYLGNGFAEQEKV